MYVYKILNLQNIIEPETNGEKTYFYVQNKYVVSTNQDISVDASSSLLGSIFTTGFIDVEVTL